MVSNGNVITLDAKRFRPGMRGLAHEIAVEISSPLNSDLWKPCETKESKRITSSHITGALGPIAHLWSSDDWDASSRIIHMSILLLYAISSGQYTDKEMIGRALICQSAAESVRMRLAEKESAAQTCPDASARPGT